MKKTSSLIVIICAFILCAINLRAEVETYDVDGIIYIIKDFDLLDLGGKKSGVYVYPNTDPNKIYSGRVVIPQKVTIKGKVYPVIGFEKLSAIKENNKSDLEIILPEGVVNITGECTPTPAEDIDFWTVKPNIKKLNIPSTVKIIDGFEYAINDTINLPSTLAVITPYSRIVAKYVTIEDGMPGIGFECLVCNNDTIIAPGSTSLDCWSICDKYLKCLHITKSKTDKSPTLGWAILKDPDNLESIICEYETPPYSNYSFELVKNEDRILYKKVTLYVPASSVDLYKNTWGWTPFEKILPITNGVTDVTADEAAEVIATEYYDLSGRRLQAPAESGITIVATRYSDGSRSTAKLAR